MNIEEFDNKFYELPGDSRDYELIGDLAATEPTGLTNAETQIQYFFEELRSRPELEGVSDKGHCDSCCWRAERTSHRLRGYVAKANFYAVKSAAYVAAQQFERGTES